jgi:hypothetical protein
MKIFISSIIEKHNYWKTQKHRGFCVYRKRLQKQKYLALLLYAHEKITEDFVQV